MHARIFEKEITAAEIEAYLPEGYIIEGHTVSHHASSEELEFHRHVPELAAKHIGGTLGLGLVGYKPLDLAYSDQRLVATHRKADPNSSIALIEGLAGTVPGLHRIGELVDGFRSRPGLLRDRRRRLQEGQNIGLITPHGAIYDIPEAQTAELIALGDDELIPRSATMMSKILTRFELEVPRLGTMPSTALLSLAGVCWYSIPRTDSIRDSRMDNRIAEAVNPHLHKDMGDWLNGGGKRVAMAPSGGIDKDGVMQRMSSGTASMLASFNSVLPVAINVNAPDDKPWFIIGEATERAHNNPAAAHDLMEELAIDMTTLTGMQYYYKKERVSATERMQEVGHVVGERLHVGTRKIKTEFEQRREERRNKKK